MSEFFAELKRRHIYRVGAAYVVVAWAITQVVDVLSQVFELASWIAQPAVVLLALGFPVALIVAWTIESKPHEAVASAVRSKPTIVDWTLCGALAVVMLLIAYQQIAPRQAGVDAARTAAASQASAISLAVLPFANLSGDSSQEFFSDGITEEITSALARVPDLRVVGRTSAFQFKGQNQDLRVIGQALGTTHLIEGSVRKAGNRLRIGAQLILAENGARLWTETFDRDLTDIFAVQEDIAQAIAGALRVPLGLQQGELLVSNRSIDPESYEQFLRAKALVRARGSQPVTEAIARLEELLARHPEFAPAWALLAGAYDALPGYSPAQRIGAIEDARRLQQSSLDKAEKAAREAIRLDARNATGYAALASIQDHRGTWDDAGDSYREALVLDPNEPETLHNFSQFLARVGRLSEALNVREKLRALEPSVPLYNIRTAQFLQLKAGHKATIPMLEMMPADAAGGVIRNVYLAQAYAAEGRYTTAADTLLEITSDLVSRQSVDDAARLLRSAPTRVSAPAGLPVLEGELNFVYGHIGAVERLLEFPERWLDSGRSIHVMIWTPEFAPVRKTERFKALVRKAGLVDYWRERGWPDLCRPVGADDFACD